MDFSFLECYYQKRQEILVIGKTIERDGQKFHMIGMSLSKEAQLYILEPYKESNITCKPEAPENVSPNQRAMLKDQKEISDNYLNCRCFYLGEEKLQVQGGTGSPLQYSANDYGIIQLFFDMMNAGWTVPEWLKEVPWECLQLITLDIANLEKLPNYLPKTPITILHGPTYIHHFIEKKITFHIGKCCNICFIDHSGDEVQCYINDVTLIDVWKDTEERFKDPKLSEILSPQQLEQAKEKSYQALEQSCPKGMCYIGIEYECSKDISLVFYSEQFLESYPVENHGSVSLMLRNCN